MSDSENKRNDKKLEKKLTREQQKELDMFSKELVKRISTATTRQRSRKMFTKVNPLVILTSLIIASIVFYSFFLNLSSADKKLSLNEVISGIKSNQYSEVTIQNDGAVVVQDKTYVISKADIDKKDLKNKVGDSKQIEEVLLEDLFKESEDRTLVDQIRSFFGTNATGLKEILLAENFVIAIPKSVEQEVMFINEISPKEFENYVKDKNIDLKGVEVVKLAIYAEVINEESFKDRFESDQIESIISIDETLIAKLKEDQVQSYTVDWTPSIYSFTDILIQQGISLEENNFAIITENVPSGINLSDVLTILTIVIFIVLAVIIFRSAQASGMGIMQFGQSKAKMFFGQKTDTTFADVAGIDEAREELNEIVDFLRNPNKYRKLGARIPKGILMVGSPGTGKTLLARAIAGEAQVPFFHTSGSEFEEMLVGAGASRVRDLFAKAKKAAPALIFIDEIDAVARKRGTRIQSGSTEQTLNQILVEMDGFEKNTNVIVIAATNRPDVLDPAILRPGRFDRQVRIEVPDKDGRLAILKIHGKNKPFAKDVDLEKIAKRTVGFTGADLENILNEAAIIAAKEGKKEISTADIDEAVSKVILGPAKKSRKRTDEELKLVAYHEAGHALVAKLTKGAIPVDKISIISRGGSGGVTMFLPEKDENIVSKSRLIAEITVSLGGRAAEEVVLDDISTGASSDIQKATQVARRMVQKFGMSDALGLVQYGQSIDSEYLGYAYDDMKDYSERTAEIIDTEVRGIIEKSYADAVKIIKDNIKMLDKIANLLLEKEVVDKEEFESLFE